MLKGLKSQYISILAILVLLGVFAVSASAQGILSPRYLRQDGATDGQRLCWTTANGYWAPCSDSGSGVASLNGLTGATQTFADVDDTNVTVAIASTGTTHTWTLGWSGVLGLSRGGTGADLSATGGANQFVRQNSAGGVLSVGSIADADVPDNITISLAATATALAANPNDCSAGQYATAIAANGDLTCAQVAWSQIGSTTDVIGTAQLDDDADTPGSGDYVRVDTVDQAGFEYRTTAEVLSDIGAAASGHTHTTTTISGLDISDDTNLAVTAPVVLTDDTLSLNQNAGTDITADLEEETHASEHAENAADELLVESLGTACTIGQHYESDGSGGVDCADASGGSTRGSVVDLTNSGADDLTQVTIVSGLSSPNKIEIVIQEMSTSGTENLHIQIGDSGGIENTGYVGQAYHHQNTGAYGSNTETTGYSVRLGLADMTTSGRIVIERVNGNTWVASGSWFSDSVSLGVFTGHANGVKSLSDTMTQVVIKTNSTDTFDNGNIIAYYQ